MPGYRIPPSDQMRHRLEQFPAHGIQEEDSPTSVLLSLAARVLLQETLEELFPRSLRIRCWQRKMQNVGDRMALSDKLPDSARAVFQQNGRRRE
jgi:hypothetical protein